MFPSWEGSSCGSIHGVNFLQPSSSKHKRFPNLFLIKSLEIRLGCYYILSIKVFSSEISSWLELLSEYSVFSSLRAGFCLYTSVFAARGSESFESSCAASQVCGCTGGHQKCLHRLSVNETISLKQPILASTSPRISEKKDAILRKYFKVLTFDWGVISYQQSSFWFSGDKAPACAMEDLGYASSCSGFRANWEHRSLWHPWETYSFCPAKISSIPVSRSSVLCTVFTTCTVCNSW